MLSKLVVAVLKNGNRHELNCVRGVLFVPGRWHLKRLLLLHLPQREPALLNLKLRLSPRPFADPNFVSIRTSSNNFIEVIVLYPYRENIDHRAKGAQYQGTVLVARGRLRHGV